MADELMRDPRLSEMEFLSHLDRLDGGVEIAKLGIPPQPYLYGLSLQHFEDMVIYLHGEGCLDAPHMDLNFPPAAFVKQNATIRLKYKGRLRLWSLKAELESERRVDPLTGLYTREAFAPDFEIGWIVLPRDSSVTVMAVDLDEFDTINNVYNHSTGDEALRRFSNTIKETVGKLGKCYRFGGDEFVVLGYPIGKDVAPKLAESIRANVERSFIEMQGIDRVPKRPTASIGVGVFTKKLDHQRAYEYADALERTAKREGKNCFRLGILE